MALLALLLLMALCDAGEGKLSVADEKERDSDGGRGAEGGSTPLLPVSDVASIGCAVAGMKLDDNNELAAAVAEGEVGSLAGGLWCDDAATDPSSGVCRDAVSEVGPSFW